MAVISTSRFMINSSAELKSYVMELREFYGFLFNSHDRHDLARLIGKQWLTENCTLIKKE